MTVNRRRSPPPRRRARAAGERLRAAARPTRMMDPGRGSAPTGSAGRDQICVGYVRFAPAHPSSLRGMFGSEVPDQAAHPALEEVGRRTFGLLAEAITECPRP